MRREILVGLFGVGIGLGCAGAKAPATSDVSPSGLAPLPATDAAAPTAASAAAPVASGPADAATATAPAASAATPEPPVEDKCAPVALAYEKSLRAKLRQCWMDAANKSKERIVGSVKLILEIDNSGKVVGQRFAEKSELPEPIQKCMMKAFKNEPIDGKKCDMKTFTIAEKFPR